MATLFQVFQFFDQNGDPLVGGELTWYEAGTDTKKDTWIDQAETNPAPNPIVLDGEGRPPLGAIWVRGSYKLKLTDSLGAIITTIDNINLYDQRSWNGLTATIADLNSTVTNTILKTSNDTITIAERNKTILCDDASGDITLNLPSAATVGNKYRIYFKKVNRSINKVILSPDGSETVDGITPYLLNDYNDVVGLQSDASNWHCITHKIRGQTRVVSTTPFNIDLSHEGETLLVNASAESITLELPVVTDVARGYRIKIKKTDATTNAVIINAQGAETIDGQGSLSIKASQASFGLVSDGVNWHIETGYELETTNQLPKWYIGGFEIARHSGDLLHDIECYSGECRDHADSTNIIRSSIIKQIDAPWAEGTNQGGRAGSLDADAWYHFFVIAVPGTTGQTALKVDAGFDKSVTATALLSAAAPFGYTKYRYVGSVLTDSSSHITPFTMLDYGSYREVIWDSLITVTKSGTGSGTGTVTTRTPKDILTKTRINAVTENLAASAILIYFKSTFQASQTPTVSDGLPQLTAADGSTEVMRAANTFEITASTTQIIDYNLVIGGAAAWNFWIITQAWLVNLRT